MSDLDKLIIRCPNCGEKLGSVNDKDKRDIQTDDEFIQAVIGEHICKGRKFKG